MPTTTRKSITIDASAGAVFDVVAHIQRFSEAVPQIEDVEILSASERGVGTRFRETRIVNGREGSTVLEVTEYVEGEMVRIVSDAGGTTWDTLFTTTPANGGTKLDMVMEARPHTFFARLSTPLIKGMVARGIEADLVAVKEYCEAR